MARSPNWEKIKTEYITTEISQKDLAKKHKISARSLENIARSEKWYQERKKYRKKVTEKAVQKSVEKESNALSEIARLKTETALLLWKATNRAAGRITDNEEMDTGDLRRVTQCFVDLVSLPEEQADTEEAHNALVKAILESSNED